MKLPGMGARRLPLRSWPRSIRRAGQVLCLWLLWGTSLSSGSASAQAAGFDNGQGAPNGTAEILSAEYTGPTTRYAHGVLGDAVEWSGLSLTLAGPNGTAMRVEIELPKDHVFEDLKPRLVDLSLDGRADAVMVVETDMAQGAALALYGADGKIAETPHIGQSNRWLAPIGAADLDGDGHVELAYIDRPHLAKTLRIWRYDGRTLTEVASLPGLTNHRIGQDFITSGIRNCENGPEIVTVDASWSRIMASRLTVAGIKTRDIGPFSGTQSVEDALTCE
ncbi:FG-GAP repeat domain-containing protein [Phaeobacter gallaeciensis]|uniref:FG-GAP repeat domain-containing protein n=1 Tax=Phaeobacter gallaeciensis TaxID=60890 RepID=UPI003CD02202